MKYLIVILALALQACDLIHSPSSPKPEEPISITEPLPDTPVWEPPAIEAIKLSWIAPSERIDNSPLTLSEIAGYKVYQGNESGVYTTTTFTTEWFYIMIDYSHAVVTTVDLDGRESIYSTEVTL